MIGFDSPGRPALNAGMPLACRLLSSLAVVTFISASAPWLPAKDAWIRVEGDGIVVLSDAAQKDAVEFAVNYSAFRRAFNEWFVPAGRRLPPTHLVLFRRRATLLKYCSGPQGWDVEKTVFTSGVDGSALLALSLAGDRQRPLETVFEYDTAWSLARIGYFLPLWMGQGAGEVMSTLRIEKGGSILGRDPGDIVSSLGNEDWFPWDRFSRIQTVSPEYNGDKWGTCIMPRPGR